MGRHSAPGDEDVDELVDEPTDAGLTLVTGASGDADEARGRHARDAAATAVDTALATEVIDATGVVPVAEPAAPTGPIVPVEAAPLAAAPDEAGREATPDDVAVDETALDEIALDEIVLDEIVLDEIAPDETAAKRESGTQADLRLLRENAAVRWQVLGAVLVSFAVYTLVMLSIGRLGDYAYWVWIPIVLSGVLVGAVLDWAHRRARRTE